MSVSVAVLVIVSSMVVVDVWVTETCVLSITVWEMVLVSVVSGAFTVVPEAYLVTVMVLVVVGVRVAFLYVVRVTAGLLTMTVLVLAGAQPLVAVRKQAIIFVTTVSLDSQH